jgi:hypothetical protein
MALAAMIVAVVALAFGAVAYWRAGGNRDVEVLRREMEREIDVLRARQRELVEGASAALAATYEGSRRRLERNRERLRALRAETIEGLEQQVDRAAEQLHPLAERLEAAAKAVSDSTLTLAHTIERGIAKRVRRLEARTMLLTAKVRATRAGNFAERREFERAERQLVHAADLLRTAYTKLRGDAAYDEGFAAVELALAAARAAVRAKADDTRRLIERVVREADAVVGRLEADEHCSATPEPGKEGRRADKTTTKI